MSTLTRNTIYNLSSKIRLGNFRKIAEALSLLQFMFYVPKEFLCTYYSNFIHLKEQKFHKIV